MKKDLYIYKIINIIGKVKSLVKKDVESLYKDAIYNHLIREGYSEFRAEVESRRRMRRDDELK
jgi:hypothetical protein